MDHRKDLGGKQLGPHETIDQIKASFRLQQPMSMEMHSVFCPSSYGHIQPILFIGRHIASEVCNGG